MLSCGCGGSAGDKIQTKNHRLTPLLTMPKMEKIDHAKHWQGYEAMEHGYPAGRTTK